VHNPTSYTIQVLMASVAIDPSTHACGISWRPAVSPSPTDFSLFGPYENELERIRRRGATENFQIRFYDDDPFENAPPLVQNRQRSTTWTARFQGFWKRLTVRRTRLNPGVAGAPSIQGVDRPSAHGTGSVRLAWVDEDSVLLEMPDRLSI